MRDSVAVLDIGSMSIVTLVGENGVNRTLNIIGKGEVTYAGFQNAEFLEPENLKFAIANSISNAELSSDAKISEIYIGVPSEFCTCITKSISLSFPKAKRISKLDVENIFRIGNTFKNEPNFSLINNSVIYYELDGGKRVINPEGQKTGKITGQISYILAMKEFLGLIKSIFSELKIEIKGFVSSALAECLYLFEPAMRDKYVLLVDVGYITTSVALTRGNGLLFLSSFSMGGGYISSDLSQCLKISFNEARRLKRKIVLGWNAGDNDTYEVEGEEFIKTYPAKISNEIVMARVEMICDYISKCLDKCAYDLPDFLPIYITGGGMTSIRGIVNVMSKKLGRQIVQQGSKNFKSTKPFDTSEEGLLYIVLNMQNLAGMFITK